MNLSDKSMEKLVELLIECEEKQNKIHTAYHNAAEKDLDMVPLKQEEKLIRLHIKSKGGFA